MHVARHDAVLSLATQSHFGVDHHHLQLLLSSVGGCLTTTLVARSLDMVSLALEGHRRFLEDVKIRRVKRQRSLQRNGSSADNGEEETTSTWPNVVPGAETLANDYLIQYITTGEWNSHWIKATSPDEECRE